MQILYFPYLFPLYVKIAHRICRSSVCCNKGLIIMDWLALVVATCLNYTIIFYLLHFHLLISFFILSIWYCILRWICFQVVLYLVLLNFWYVSGWLYFMYSPTVICSLIPLPLFFRSVCWLPFLLSPL